MILLQQMLALFGLMAVGFFCGKKDILDGVTTRKLSWLVINIANVAMIVKAGLSDRDGITGANLMLACGLSVATYAVLLLLAAVIPALLRAPRSDYGVFRAMLVFSNIGFMGMPLLAALKGEEAVIYYTFFQFPYSVLIYTYGIAMLRGRKPDPAGTGDSAVARAKAGGGNGAECGQPWWRNLINPGLAGCVAALVLFFGGIKLPDFATTLLSNLSNLTLPLSMLVIGQSFTQFRFRELFTDARLLVFAGIKLLVIPVISLLALKQFITNDVLLMTCLVMLSTPAGSMTAMMAQQYGGNFRLASKGVALTTLLSVATMPIVSMIAGI